MAEDANELMEEENAALRRQLAQVQQQLQVIREHPLPVNTKPQVLQAFSADALTQLQHGTMIRASIHYRSDAC